MGACGWREAAECMPGSRLEMLGHSKAASSTTLLAASTPTPLFAARWEHQPHRRPRACRFARANDRTGHRLRRCGPEAGEIGIRDYKSKTATWKGVFEGAFPQCPWLWGQVLSAREVSRRVGARDRGAPSPLTFLVREPPAQHLLSLPSPLMRRALARFPPTIAIPIYGPQPACLLVASPAMRLVLRLLTCGQELSTDLETSRAEKPRMHC